MSFNIVILHGHLTRDVELRFAGSGTAIATFGLAVNHSYTNETGQKKDTVCFIDITAFGQRAKVLAQYLSKGKPLLLEGRLAQETWEDKETRKHRSKLKVILESFTFVHARQYGDGKPERQARQPVPGEQAGQVHVDRDAQADEEPDADDVPF